MSIVTRGLGAQSGMLASFGLGRKVVDAIIDLGLDIHHFVVEILRSISLTVE